MEPIIATEELTVKFGSFTAVQSVSLTVERGEIFGFLGPNGSGKTTLIKALCGLVKIHSGAGRLFGLDVSRHAGEIKRRVGYMSQRFGLYEDLTVKENIAFYGALYGLDPRLLASRMAEVMALTSLEPYADRRAGQLSGGWKQRLALSCAIVHNPEIVFLDEPTAGIDPVARRALWDLLFRLSAENVTFFVTTHYMDEAERCGRVGYIFLSRLIAIGTVEDLVSMKDANPAGTVRIEIHAGRAAALVEWLRGQTGVREATLYGRAARALIETAHRAAIEDAVRKHSPEATLRPAEPLLEDVFVTLTLRESHR